MRYHPFYPTNGREFQAAKPRPKPGDPSCELCHSWCNQDCIPYRVIVEEYCKSLDKIPDSLLTEEKVFDREEALEKIKHLENKMLK